MKNKSVFWGLFCISIAVLIVISKLGMFLEFNWFSIVVAVLMLPLIISSIIGRDFFGVIMPLAIIAIMFTKQLGIENFSSFTIIGIALLLIIGLSIIFPNKRAKENYKTNHSFHDGNVKTEVINDEEVSLYSKFGGSAKYINSNNLRHVRVDASFSGIKVYLDGATFSSDGVTIEIWSDFSGVELYIPKECNVEKSIECFFAGTDEEGIKNSPKTGAKIMLSGKIKFSGVTIIYV